MDRLMVTFAALLVLSSLAASFNWSDKRSFDGKHLKRQTCDTETPYEPISGPDGPCEEYCYCVDGEVMCTTEVVCEPTNCVDYEYEEGECCPKCYNGENCNIKGKVVPFGEIVRTEKAVGDSIRVETCQCAAGAFDEPDCEVDFIFP